MIGSGYVGLVSGACFSDFGWNVACVDKDLAKVESLRAGNVPIYEPGLDDLLARNIAASRLSFTSDVAATVPEADIIFLADGTPMRRGDGYADLSYVCQAVEELAPHLRGSPSSPRSRPCRSAPAARSSVACAR
jgi:UDPglucose 6-dehydrogenase